MVRLRVEVQTVKGRSSCTTLVPVLYISGYSACVCHHVCNIETAYLGKRIHQRIAGRVLVTASHILDLVPKDLHHHQFVHQGCTAIRRAIGVLVYASEILIRNPEPTRDNQIERGLMCRFIR